MPKFCIKCNEWYIVRLNDFPEIHCMWCKVGIHDCSKLNEVKDVPGIKWLCDNCEPMFNKHFLPKLDQGAFFEGFDVNGTIEKGKAITEQKKTTENIESEDDAEEIVIIENPLELVPTTNEDQNLANNNPSISSSQQIITSQTASNNPTLPTNQPIVTNQREDIANQNNQTVIPSNVNNQPDFKDVKRYPNMNRDQMCRFLARGTCRYGANGENELGKCNRYHPNQCKDYNQNGTTENGCKKGNECNNWHATYICRLSINSNVCTRINCIYKHHKNCSTTNNENEYNFLANNQYSMPRQQRGPNYQGFNNRQPYQHQQRQQNQLHMNNQWPSVYQQQQQQQQQHMGNQWPPAPQHQYSSQVPQAQEDRLMHLIREFLRGERMNY